jgi:hypothetical protein
LPACCDDPLLKVGDVGRMTVLDFFLKPTKRFAVSKALTRNFGMPPNQNETLVGGAKSSTQKIIEGMSATSGKAGGLK